MAHANRHDTSFQLLPPLLSVASSQKVRDLRVSQKGFRGLGSYTGERMAVCVYPDPRFPPLVAFDYEEGSVLWTAPVEDLPGSERRRIPGILMAKVTISGNAPVACVFAANPVEFVAYSATGAPIWKRPIAEIVEPGLGRVGAPSSLTFTDNNEIVAPTSRGWIVKLDPLDGAVIDAYRMEVDIWVGGRRYRGYFASFKSHVVVGNTLYIVVKFRPDSPGEFPSHVRPIYLVRIDLDGPERNGRRSIKPLYQQMTDRERPPDRLLIGVNRVRGGSPSACQAQDGRVYLFANAETMYGGRSYPLVVAADDGDGHLRKRWTRVFEELPGDRIHGAPALHAESGTLVVSTMNRIHVLRDALSSTTPPSPHSHRGQELITSPIAFAAGEVAMGGPMALAQDPGTEELVVVTNFRLTPTSAGQSHGWLGAFGLPPRALGKPRAIWTRPLAITEEGDPAPGPGTFGQPALFQYNSPDGPRSGLVVNTVLTGTYFFR
jgi:hypothetical protein